MSESTAVAEPHRKRHRHRSPRRKLTETIALIVGVPALLFVVLALSVELIEYHPAEGLSPAPTSAVTPKPVSALRPGGRLRHATVVDFAPIGIPADSRTE